MTSKKRPIVSARLTQEEVVQWRMLRKLYRKERKTDAALLRHLIRQEFSSILWNSPQKAESR